jgi:hypothetical protein
MSMPDDQNGSGSDRIEPGTRALLVEFGRWRSLSEF